MNGYTYCEPKNLIDALKVVAEYSSRARVAAGCTNILPDMKSGKLAECVLVDIGNLAELKGIQSDEGALRLGALVTLNEILANRAVREQIPLLWQTGRKFGDILVRNRATIGGNLAQASPAADTAVALLVLEATIFAESLALGRREIPIGDFFVAPGRSALRPDELLISLKIPRMTQMACAFVKFSLRQAMAISVASIALALEVEGDTIQSARLAFGALAPTPRRASRTEQFLAGRKIGDATFEEAAVLAQQEVQPISDLRSSADYRTHLAAALLKKAARAALASKDNPCRH